MTNSHEPATPRQQQVLYQIIETCWWKDIPTMSKTEAHRIIANHAAKWRTYSPSPRQERFLRSWARWQPGLTRGEASDRIAEIKSKTAKMTRRRSRRSANWRWRSPLCSRHEGG